MNRVSNSYLAMSVLLGQGQQGVSGDDTANLIRSAALRTPKATPAKTAELPAKAATPAAVTVSLSQAAQAALAKARAAVQGPATTVSTPTAQASEPVPVKAEPQAAAQPPAPEAKTETAPVKPRSIFDIDWDNVTADDSKWLIAYHQAGKANHDALMMWVDLDSRNRDEVTPAEARTLLAKLEPLMKASEGYDFKDERPQIAADFLADRAAHPDDYKPTSFVINGARYVR